MTLTYILAGIDGNANFCQSQIFEVKKVSICYHHMDSAPQDRERKPGAGPNSLGRKGAPGGVRRNAFQTRSPSFALSSLRSIRSVRSPSTIFRNKEDAFQDGSGDKDPWGVSAALAKTTEHEDNQDEVIPAHQKARLKGRIKKSASDGMGRKGDPESDRSKSRLKKLFKAKTWGRLRSHKNVVNGLDAGDSTDKEEMDTIAPDPDLLTYSDDEEEEEDNAEGEKDDPISMAEDDFISYVVHEKKKERGERPVVQERLNSLFRRPSIHAKAPGR